MNEDVSVFLWSRKKSCTLSIITIIHDCFKVYLSTFRLDHQSLNAASIFTPIKVSIHCIKSRVCGCLCVCLSVLPSLSGPEISWQTSSKLLPSESWTFELCESSQHHNIWVVEFTWDVRRVLCGVQGQSGRPGELHPGPQRPGGGPG